MGANVSVEAPVRRIPRPKLRVPDWKYLTRSGVADVFEWRCRHGSGHQASSVRAVPAWCQVRVQEGSKEDPIG